MKRLWIILLVVGLIMSSTVAYGEKDDKLSNHWAKDVIDSSFMAYYFPYLVKDNFEAFDPSGPIIEKDFKISLTSLLKEYRYEATIEGFLNESPMSRESMVELIGGKLAEISPELEEKVDIPFKDTNTMSDTSIELLRLVYNYGIIKGEDNSSFAPNRYFSQAEAIIVLQRVREVLEDMNTVTFEVVGRARTFNNQEEIIVTRGEDNILVTITKEFPTPGYSMDIDKIRREKNGYRILFNINPPKPDSIQLQVITYITLTLEIDKDDLGPSPYNFILDGYNKITVAPTN